MNAMLCFFSLGSLIRSSRPDVFCENGVLRNFAKFTGKHLCQSLFFNKVAGAATLRSSPPEVFYKRGVLRIFVVNFAKFLRTPFLTEHQRATSSDLRGLQERCSGCEWIFWILLFSGCFKHKTDSRRGTNSSHFVKFRNLPWWQYL